MPSAALIAIGGALWLVIAYKWYGGIIDKRIVQPSDENTTPAQRFRDDKDFVPTKPAILFGHHFSSIAGAGPIVGPILAYSLFGWLPALLWVLLGSVFIGAVHDYTTHMASVRSGAVTVADIAREHISDTARWIFSAFIWLALVLILAVFAVFTAQTLAQEPRIVIPTVGVIGIALLFGYAVHRRQFNVVSGTVLAVALMFGLIVVGDFVPIEASFEFWLAFAFVYSFIAALMPVWILLQPRDYLSMYILLIGLAFAFVSLIIRNPAVHGPALVSFNSELGPLWPMLFITVACGAISGFHSIVASGTSAKQLRKETDAKKISFGGMLTEGALALVVLLLVAGVLTWKGSGNEGGGFVFQSLLSEKGPNITFGTALGLAASSLGIPIAIGTAFGILMINAFVITTLDTCARLARYVITETAGTKVRVLKNPALATFLSLAFAYLLTMGNNWKILWPAFGAANQLIGALSLLVVSAYFLGHKKSTLYTLIPAVFMLATTEGALLYQLFSEYIPKGNSALAIVAILLSLLGFIVAVEVYKRFRRRAPEAAPTPGVTL